MKQILYLFLFASVSLFGQNTQNTISAGMAGGESPDSSCVVQITRNNLIVLRNAAQLEMGCHYLITDHVQGRLVAGTRILLHAVSSNLTSETAMVLTTYDNEAWTGIYDLDRSLVLELQDNRNNIARGYNGVEVSNFDWGNTAYTNVLVDNSTLTVTYGNTAQIINVKIMNVSTVTLTGFTGQLNNSTIQIASNVNLTNANGTWRFFEIKDNSILNASGYTGGGDNYYNTIYNVSNINLSNSVSAAILRQNTFDAANITHANVSSGTFTLTNSNVFGSTVNHSSGAGNFSATANNNLVSGSQILHQTGTMTLINTHNISSTIQQSTNAGATMSLNQAHIKQGANISNQAAGQLNINQSEITQSTATRQAGATGNLTISTSKIWNNSNVTIVGTNTGSTTVSNCVFENGNVTNSSAVIMSLTRVYLRSLSNINANVGSVGNMTINDTELTSLSYFSKLNTSTTGNISIVGSTFTGNSFVQHGGTGNLIITHAVLDGFSGINVISGNRSYTLNRILATNISRANLSGTGAVTDNFTEVELKYRGTITISCSGAANNINYCTIEGLNGALVLSGTTGNKALNRIKLRDGSLVIANNANAATFAMFSINDLGRINIQAQPAGTTIQYIDVSNGSSFTVNKTGAGTLQYITVRNNATVSITAGALAITKLDVEQGVFNCSGGTINNVSKKMQSTFTVTGGVQTNVCHWTTTNKTTANSNTNRVDYLGLNSTAPIL